MTSNTDPNGAKPRFWLERCPRCHRALLGGAEWPVGTAFEELRCLGCEHQSDKEAALSRDKALGLTAVWN